MTMPPAPTPSDGQSRFQQALELHQRGLLADAERIYAEVLRAQPRHFDALHLMGLVAAQTGRRERADLLIGKAIEINPGVAAVHSNRGKILNDMGRRLDAVASCDKAIALDPAFVGAYVNRGNALNDLGRYEEAVASYDKAIALRPDVGEAYSDRANTLQKLNRYADALASYRMAIKLKPDHAPAYTGMGVVFQKLKRHEEALAYFGKSVAVAPDYAEGYNNLGNLLAERKRYEEAIANYSRAVALNPNCEFLYGTWLHTRMKICDWEGLDAAFDHIVEKIDRSARVSPPFPLISMPISPDRQRKAAEIWTESTGAQQNSAQSPKYRRHDKIRLGYYSSDFYNHATSWLIAGLFESHDRSRFELTAFSFGPRANDEMSARLSAAFDRFVYVAEMADRDIATLSNEMEIDIAVDLKGYTTDCRTNIFAFRAAPIQVNYLGFPGTMGASYIDYLIADRTLIPPEQRPYYSEKIAYIPDSYQINDSKKVISDRIWARAEAGLPETGVVFCCFNNNYKINPDVFDCWARILDAVDGSVLWLFEDTPAAAANLRRAAAARGLSPERIVFAERLPLAEHLARHCLADLFIDTWPCNAHTTASDALWAGLPLLTVQGETFAGRVAASLLNATGLSELIAASPAAYEALAIELGATPQKLARLKRTLAENRLSSSLFDTPLVTARIEAAYTQMYERGQADLPPADIDIE